jgi:hypothetical protein
MQQCDIEVNQPVTKSLGKNMADVMVRRQQIEMQVERTPREVGECLYTARTLQTRNESLSQDRLDASPFLGSNLCQSHGLELLEVLGMANVLLEVTKEFWTVILISLSCLFSE